MARYTGPKNRIARRFGVNIFSRARNPMLHKPNPPGVHGAKRKKKSDYGLQLEELKKLSAVYGMISRKQIVKYFRKAQTSPMETPLAFIQQLECRLDSLVYRFRMASTIFAAQQLVNHGHILVDGNRVDIRSFQVSPEQVITVKEKSQNRKDIKTSLEHLKDVPEYIEVDVAKFLGKLIVRPDIDQIPFPINIDVPLICEFLAHNS